MIGCLIGEVFALEAPTVLLNVNGVGYEIDTPLSTFCQLQKGQKVTLWTHLVVREDAQQLYGFSNAQEKTIFRTLLKVNGVGPKMALGILSTLSVELLVHTIEHDDLNTLVKIPGVGKKTAERLMIELRDRFKTLAQAATTSSTALPQIQFIANSPIAEAEAALQSLGYKPQEAQKAVAAVKGDFSESADLIRAALKSMMK
ncbi:Holliday junction branch migration protein RuvA [Acinetobacter radioresistens]|jgi:holliday junction DNA helicase RuvA|uniref:Holliday junction branch migration complex subunit RuvA n=1 Tax=Acinetobacter radioresistens SK82 TaxID=596318 RepID=A0ABM9YKR4_ACIRA|nr:MULTISPECIES: Holliday junction branch migration protein RuvA [Acinetobacter]AWV86805.1 Holliday junction branch migration protein RuvA [Acinetobacter radioresistens]EET81430.1 Holliday junction DNA helicase RuvA [Acinetobacter radioresistens SK82]EEY86783.1 Holliday junction DNA helicase RuvA [Acinetobacter radioresistens SH164]EJO34820.1 Holliday junction DNA helicase RuvA [Acinetobacter radioresistens WC-A-157]ENV84491.1 Holliday junction ATP-dependent DNA helicase ruvA [Acinetobacter ra